MNKKIWVLPVLFSACLLFTAACVSVSASVSVPVPVPKKQVPSNDEVKYQTSFAKDKWNEKDFMYVKSPRLKYMKTMLQKKNCIVNPTPDLSDEEIFSKHSNEVYVAMVLNWTFTGSATISSKMSFDHRMAPLILIAPELGKSTDDKPELREHYEIVLFDQGINVWHHLYKDGKPSWYKAAFIKAAYLPRTVYDLQVELKFDTNNRCMMIMRCDGVEFGYAELKLKKGKPYYAGIIACEGRNRFYDFKVTQPRKKVPAKKTAKKTEKKNPEKAKTAGKSEKKK